MKMVKKNWGPPPQWAKSWVLLLPKWNSSKKASNGLNFGQLLNWNDAIRLKSYDFFILFLAALLAKIFENSIKIENNTFTF